MKVFIFIVIIATLQVCYAPPVTEKKKEAESEDSEINGLEDYMEYHRYLKEVVNALESDPDFRSKLEKADEKDIKSGKIAEELQFVSHHVRTRLDEIKRVELDRLKELVLKKKQLEDPNSIIDDPLHHHIDHANPHTFEIEDLKKLIAKTTADLAEADRKRKEQFKQYEMEKEYQKQEKLNHTTGTEREKLEKELKEMEEKHKKHEKLHEPGHKAQLEEVWEEQDQMQQDFDPKTFFMLHDLDGNGLWDQDEVKALFIKELDKMYQQGHPEDDMRERAEEMERMRESVFHEMDTNQDGFIDFDEFMKQTNTSDFKQDHGWQSLDEQKPYTDEELQEYIRYHHANQNNGYMPPEGYHQQPPQGYQHHGDYQGQGYEQPQGGYQHQQAGNQQQYGGYQQHQGGYQQQQGGYQQQQGGYQQHPNIGNHPNAIPQANIHQQGQQMNYNQNYLNTNEIHQQYPHEQQNQQVPQGQQQQVPQSQQHNVLHSQQQFPQSQHQQVPQSQQQQVPQYQQQQVPQSQQQQVPQSQQQQVPQSQQQQVPQSQQHQVPQTQQQIPQVQPQQVPQVQQQQAHKAPEHQAPQVQQQYNNQQPNVQPPQVQQHHP